MSIEKREIFEMVKRGELSIEESVEILRGRKPFPQLKPEPAPKPQTESSGIAVIGLSGRYPQANSVEEYWNNLQAGKDCSSLIPPERWDYNEYFDPDPAQSKNGKMYSKWGCFLKDVDKFDPLFFKISPAEAETMDPQERLFLEVAWETLEDAGYTRQSIREYVERDELSDVGVFVGETTNSYLLYGPEEWTKGNKVIPTSMPWSIANRVSYCFNFYGPSISIDTACSSGLSAIHLACESINKGECSMAIAGGVNIYLHPIKYVWLCQMTMLSKKGKCHTFGIDADGFLPGEGIGALLLKPLDKALRDGDNIYAVIKGTAVNHDGKTTGYSVPSPTAQSNVILQALKKSGFDARTISFIEAHGTGTELGDPIEVVGLTGAFRKYTDDCAFCAISSSKSNIGHSESTAGIAGITKIIMQMKYKKLVPSLHCEVLNPKIEFSSTPFYVQRQLMEWEQPLINGEPIPRRAGVSSFGAGGVNSHVVLEEFIREEPLPVNLNQREELFILSAKNMERLDDYIKRLLDFLKSNEGSKVNFNDLISTLMIGREAMEARLAIICRNKAELVSSLEDTANNRVDNRQVFLDNIKSHRKRLSSEKPDAGRLRLMSEGRDLGEIALWWVKGVNFDWKLVQGKISGKISLPCYPFSREPLWIKRVPSANIEVESTPKLHPLLESNISTFREQKFTTTFTGDEFFLADHVISREKILPGVAYLEMARAAAVLTEEGQRVAKIGRVTWTNPIKVSNCPKRIELTLYLEKGNIGYEVISNENNRRVIHGTGKIIMVKDSSPTNQPALNLEAIRGRCPNHITADGCYDWYKRRSIVYGPTFRGIEELYYNDNEALAYIKLHESLLSQAKKYLLHPALMDSALQSMFCFLEPAHISAPTTYLPFSIGEVNILATGLPPDCFVYVENIATNKADLKKFKISLFSNEEKLLVEVKDFVVRAYKREPDVISSQDQQLLELLRKVEKGKMRWHEAERVLGGRNE